MHRTHIKSRRLLVVVVLSLAARSQLALAQSAPDEGVVALRYYDYRDWQPGVDRMSVKSPSLYALVPLSPTLAVEGSLVYDSVSGASPLFHDTVSGASGRGIEYVFPTVRALTVLRIRRRPPRWPRRA